MGRQDDYLEKINPGGANNIPECLKKYMIDKVTEPEEPEELSASDPVRDIKKNYDQFKALAKDVEDCYTGPPVIIIGSGMSGKHIAIAAHLAGFSCGGPHVEVVDVDAVERAKRRFAFISGSELTEGTLHALKTISEHTGNYLPELIDNVTNLLVNKREAFDLTGGIPEVMDRPGHCLPEKVEQFKIKNVGMKIGGSKHKKNPFRYRK